MASALRIFFVVSFISLVGSRNIKRYVHRKPENVRQAGQMVGTEGKESKTTENIARKVDVVDYTRNLIYAFGNASEEDVRRTLPRIKNLDPSAIPPTIDIKNQLTVESFQHEFRTFFAVLRASKAWNVKTFAKELVKIINETCNYERMATLMAQLSYKLSELTNKEEFKEEVDSDNEYAMIDVLKRRGIVHTNILYTAQALYRSNPQIAVTNKKIKIHAPDIEEEALTQFTDCYNQDFVVEAALMPDAHAGYVAPIGSVIKTKDAVVPSWVGYDIGCGMIAVKIAGNISDQDFIRKKATEIFDEVNKNIPMGVGGHNKNGGQVYLQDKMEKALDKLKQFTAYRHLFDEIQEKSRPNLGTLGSGNHFIEISVHNDETWLVIHSGSRNVGHSIGTYFMKAVSGLKKGYENTYAIKDPEMREEYMYFQDYCLEFALLSRMSMAVKVEKAIKDITGIKYDTYENLWTNKNHNHCIKLGNDLYLHRKGATSSDKGERGVIPGNMRDGCYLVEGLGNVDFLSSSSHGAGRAMSRTRAKHQVKLDVFEKTMKGIVAPVNWKTVDESPFAYKNITQVMELQKESVKVLKHLKPIINWKGY